MLRITSPKLAVSRTRGWARSLLILALLTSFSLPFGVLAHGGVDDEPKPATVPTGAKPVVTTVTAERNVQNDSGNFNLVLKRSPGDPRGGETEQFVVRIGETAAEQIQTVSKTIAARRTRLTLVIPAAQIDAAIWVDESGRMIRFSIPAQSLEVAREDIAAVSSRTVTVSRPNDQSVSIPSNGFNLAGTLSRPGTSSGKLPAVVLVGGSGPADRDEVAFGIPVLGDIAGALADAGFLVVRYDKRGIGQSGGRPESAGLADYADDVRAAVKALTDRKDVDTKRIAVVGHSEGGTVALLAAAKEKHIAAVVLIATAGLLVWDLWLLVHSGVEGTISRSMRALGKVHPAVPWMIGLIYAMLGAFLAWHFWGGSK